MILMESGRLTAEDIDNLLIIKNEIRSSPKIIDRFIINHGSIPSEDLSEKTLQLVSIYQEDPEIFDYELNKLLETREIAAGIITGAATVLSTLVGGIFGLGKRKKAKRAAQKAKTLEAIETAKQVLLEEQKRKAQQAKILKAEKAAKRKRQRNTAFAIGGAIFIILVLVLVLTYGRRKLKK